MHALTPIKHVKVGDIVTVELPLSGVCQHMKVAGRQRRVKLVDGGGTPMAQILAGNVGERPFSAPITMGEAGFYQDADGWYCYPALA